VNVEVDAHHFLATARVASQVTPEALRLRSARKA
jgi:hypothetical protein